jgi:large subunit ribosomal protein L3
MNGILAKKLGMTQLFNEAGECIPVTVLEAGPCVVVRHKTQDSDGYAAIQIGFGEQRESRANKPDLGQFAKAGVALKKQLCEFTADDLNEWPVGKEFGASIFSDGQSVNVSGLSKGRGFAGTIKRYGFAKGPRSHGSHNVREPGSLSGNTYPGRVFPGKKMPGHYGNKKITVKNLSIVKVDDERNLVYLKGAVPGPRNGIILIRKN